ncbi:MAG: mechanosensitive ion channel family protein [Bacteroidetes bacterium]|nr:mechanosensitive ion channel family protein [Bacteroidota bacterium]MBU1579701.1 mechanosensitive ion channel family protein [Bacteroidota bacterium]MBU2558962.1 mechanosensitive ion channel family protein [Bacteroidota bacterium]
MFEWLIDVLKEGALSLQLNDNYASILAEGTSFIILVIIAIGFYYLSWYLIKRTVYQFIKKTKTEFDDIIIRNKVVARASLLVPSWIINEFAPNALPGFPKLFGFVQETIEVYVIFVVAFILDAVITSVNDFYNTFEISRSKPIKGLTQVIKIIIYIVAFLLIIASLIDQNVGNLILGLGTLSAVLMLIFKDPILGFVGGIQLSLNDMVRIGDWISMPKYGADGDVLEITLTTVKVQNWDKTITTIPTYSMVTDYFTNWRGMSESGGRRIKRHIAIDMDSVKFCTPEMLEKYQQYMLIKNYLIEKEKDIEQYNTSNKIDTSNLVNGRRQTNLGVFRAYLRIYFEQHPRVNQDMTMLVRHLQPTELGIPIEIYVFSRNKEWAAYEALQSDIFDHVLAVIPKFDLRVFQAPSDGSINKLTESLLKLQEKPPLVES